MPKSPSRFDWWGHYRAPTGDAKETGCICHPWKIHKFFKPEQITRAEHLEIHGINKHGE